MQRYDASGPASYLHVSGCSVAGWRSGQETEAPTRTGGIQDVRPGSRTGSTSRPELRYPDTIIRTEHARSEHYYLSDSAIQLCHGDVQEVRRVSNGKHSKFKTIIAIAWSSIVSGVHKPQLRICGAKSTCLVPRRGRRTGGVEI